MEKKKNTPLVVVLGLVIAVLVGLGIFALVNNMNNEDAENGVGTNQPEAPAEPTQSIVEIATNNPDFSTLVTALQAADLVDTLSGEGPFTVFAPTNEAFAALPEGRLDALLADPDALRNVLTYHVVSGNVPASEVVGLTSATTLQGQDITIAVVDGSVVLNDTVNVTQTDLRATNGVIHVIDAVLLPQ